MLFLRCAVVNLLLSLRLAEGAAIDAQHQEIMDTARDHSIVLTDGVSTFAYEQPNDNSSEDSFNTLTVCRSDLLGISREANFHVQGANMICCSSSTILTLLAMDRRT